MINGTSIYKEIDVKFMCSKILVFLILFLRELRAEIEPHIFYSTIRNFTN